MLNSFLIYVSFTPLAVYFVLVGLMNMTGRPFLVTGWRDQLVLFLALTGFIAVGPMQLFFPVSASWSYGIGVWIMLLLVYALICTLYLLMMRPSINLYNVTHSELHAFLKESVSELDSDADVSGDTVVMPTLGIQFYLDANSAFRTLSLLSAGPNQDFLGWKKLQNWLMEAIRKRQSAFSPKYLIGISFLLLGLLMLVGLHAMIWLDSVAFLKAIPDFLRI